MIKLIKRKLKKSEIEQLFIEIKDDPNITGYSHKEWKLLDQIWLAEVQGEFAGLGNIKIIDKNWSELGLYYVLKKYRGKGIGTLLFNKTYDEVRKSYRNIYIVSRNPVMIKMMRKKGIKIVPSFFNLPFVIIIKSIIFSLNCYRMKEYFRKILKHKSFAKLVFGIAINKQ